MFFADPAFRGTDPEQTGTATWPNSLRKHLPQPSDTVFHSVCTRPTPSGDFSSMRRQDGGTGLTSWRGVLIIERAQTRVVM